MFPCFDENVALLYEHIENFSSIIVDMRGGSKLGGAAASNNAKVLSVLISLAFIVKLNKPTSIARLSPGRRKPKIKD